MLLWLQRQGFPSELSVSTTVFVLVLAAAVADDSPEIPYPLPSSCRCIAVASAWPSVLVLTSQMIITLSSLAARVA